MTILSPHRRFSETQIRLPVLGLHITGGMTYTMVFLDEIARSPRTMCTRFEINLLMDRISSFTVARC